MFHCQMAKNQQGNEDHESVGHLFSNSMFPFKLSHFLANALSKAMPFSYVFVCPSTHVRVSRTIPQVVVLNSKVYMLKFKIVCKT